MASMLNVSTGILRYVCFWSVQECFQIRSQAFTFSLSLSRFSHFSFRSPPPRTNHPSPPPPPLLIVFFPHSLLRTRKRTHKYASLCVFSIYFLIYIFLCECMCFVICIYFTRNHSRINITLFAFLLPF